MGEMFEGLHGGLKVGAAVEADKIGEKEVGIASRGVGDDGLHDLDGLLVVLGEMLA